MFGKILASWKVYAAKRAFQARDYVGVLRYANEAVAFDPENSEAFALRCRAEFKFKDQEWASILSDGEKAIELGSQDVEVLIATGAAAYWCEDYRLAIKRCLQAIQRSPEDGIAHRFYALTLFQLRDFEEAIEHFSLAIRYDPNPNDLHWRAHSRSLLCDYEGALRDVSKSLEANPNHFYALLTKANALACLGRYRESLEAYQEALSRPDAIPDTVLQRGNVRLRAGQTDWAFGDFREYFARQTKEVGRWHSAARVPVVVMYASGQLYDDSPLDGAAGVLLTFDRRLLADQRAFIDLARRAQECHRARTDLEFRVHQAVEQRMEVLNRRRPLPLEFTQGIEVYSADLRVPRSFLANERLDGVRILHCVAESGPTGKIALLPSPKVLWLARSSEF